MMELKVDPDRDLTTRPGGEIYATGIYVRALRDGKWSNADIYELDEYSLRQWINSRGPVHEWAVSLIKLLLDRQGRGPF